MMIKFDNLKSKTTHQYHLKLPSRKTLQKQLQRHRRKIIVAGIVVVGIILLVPFAWIFGVIHFQESHFNDNVTINGVDVSRLSLSQAYKKVNANGIDAYTLSNGKVYSQTFGTGKSISKKDLRTLFDRQHTLYRSNTKHRYLSPSLAKAKKELQGLYKQSTTYSVAGKTFTIKAKNVLNDVTYKNGDFDYADDKLVDKVAKINKEVRSVDRAYDFVTPEGNTVNLHNLSYGWQLDSDATTAAIENALILGEKKVDGSDYLMGRNDGDDASGYTSVNNGLGSDYVVLSIQSKKLWVIKNNQVVMTVDNAIANQTRKVTTGIFNLTSGNNPQTEDYQQQIQQRYKADLTLNDDQKKQMQQYITQNEAIVVY